MPGSSSHVSPKLTINKKKIIVHFSCQERKEKKTQTIDHRLQSNHDVYTHRTMWKRAQLHIYLYNELSDFTTGKHLMRLLNGSRAAHSLGRRNTRLAWLRDPRDLGLTPMSNPRPGLAPNMVARLKMLGPNNHVKFKCHESGNEASSKMPGSGNSCQTQTNNQKRGQLCILVVIREIKNANNQLLTTIQPWYLYTSHHVEENTTAHLFIRRMAKFDL